MPEATPPPAPSPAPAAGLNWPRIQTAAVWLVALVLVGVLVAVLIARNQAAQEQRLAEARAVQQGAAEAAAAAEAEARARQPVPHQLVAAKVEVQEGESKAWSLHLQAPSTVRVAVDAEPKAVNVLFLDSDQWGQFTAGAGTRFLASLSEMNTLRMNRTGQVAEGDWHVVVARPKVALFFKHPSVVQISVVGYYPGP